MLGELPLPASELSRVSNARTVDFPQQSIPTP